MINYNDSLQIFYNVIRIHSSDGLNHHSSVFLKYYFKQSVSDM